MGELEKRGKARKKKRDVQKAILTIVGGAALVGVAIAAPNLPGALHKLGFIKTKGDKNSIARARRNLLKRGLLKKNEKGLLRLTSKGEREFELQQAREQLHAASRRWDGRWRVLVFDIPEYRKSLRDKMRRTLMSVGFLRLQDSVWIYPHDCENFIALLKADFKIGRDVLYLIVDELEGDGSIKKKFGLK